MTNINLLPPEIRQKRAAERRRLLMGALAILVLAAVAGVYVFAGMLAGMEANKLARLKEENAQALKDITEYEVFQKQKDELAAKQKVVSDAMAGSIPWYKLMNEISLIIPAEVWLTSFDGDGEKGVTMSGEAIDRAGDAPDTGHKPVAKWMVRMSVIPMLSDIWLSSSSKGEGVVKFETSAKVKPPASSSAAPAPPGAPSAPSPPGG